MTRTDNIIAKLGLILVSLLAFSLYLWFAAVQLLMPHLSMTSTLYLIAPLPALILSAAGGTLYLRFGRPEHPRPLYIFIAVLLISLVLSFIPDPVNPYNPLAFPVMFLLGLFSPAVLCLFILSLPKTGTYIRTLKILSAIFSGIVLVVGVCIPAYLTAVQAAASGPVTGETPFFFGILTCLVLFTPIYGVAFLILGLLSLKEQPLPGDVPQTDP